MPLCPHCQTPLAQALTPCPRRDGHWAIEDRVWARYAGDPWLGKSVGGRYVVTDVIGKGSTGRVYKAHQGGIERNVVLKFFKIESLLDAEQGFEPSASLMVRREDARARFIQEAQVLGKLNHPHCVTVYDFGEEPAGRSLFIAMEYVEGVSLRDMIKAMQGGPGLEQAGFGEVSSGEVTLGVARQILVALAEAHRLGVVHRDLKPENILLTDAGSRQSSMPVVKVLDFGIAKILGKGASPALTTVGMLFGTPAYMSPEQCRGQAYQAGFQSDVYAFGCILYELITGELPFCANSPQKMIQLHLEEPVPPVVPRAGLKVPAGLDELIARCLSKAPEDRYQSAQTLLLAFDMLVSVPKPPTPGSWEGDEPERGAGVQTTIPSSGGARQGGAGADDASLESFEAPQTVVMAPQLGPSEQTSYQGRSGQVEQGRTQMVRAAMLALGLVVLCCILMFLLVYRIA